MLTSSSPSVVRHWFNGLSRFLLAHGQCPCSRGEAALRLSLCDAGRSVHVTQLFTAVSLTVAAAAAQLSEHVPSVWTSLKQASNSYRVSVRTPMCLRTALNIYSECCDIVPLSEITIGVAWSNTSFLPRRWPFPFGLRHLWFGQAARSQSQDIC